MKKRKNNKAVIILLITVFSLILISCILYLIYTFSGNYINIGYIDDSADKLSEKEAENSNILIVNGIVIGATKNGKWVTAQSYYNSKNEKTDIDVNIFSENKKLGTFKTASLKRYDNSVVYTTIAKGTIPEKYIAIKSSDEYKIIPGMTKLTKTSEDEEYVKEAIGSYKLVNGSVNITEVYASNINQTTDKIIIATSKNKNMLGVYSAVIYVTENTPYLVKYSYVRNTKNSDRWPVYSLQFVMDLNNDKKPELVIQETTGNDTSYVVLELREENRFYEVLRTTLKI